MLGAVPRYSQFVSRQCWQPDAAGAERPRRAASDASGASWGYRLADDEWRRPFQIFHGSYRGGMSSDPLSRLPDIFVSNERIARISVGEIIWSKIGRANV